MFWSVSWGFPVSPRSAFWPQVEWRVQGPSEELRWAPCKITYRNPDWYFVVFVCICYSVMFCASRYPGALFLTSNQGHDSKVTFSVRVSLSRLCKSQYFTQYFTGGIFYPSSWKLSLSNMLLISLICLVFRLSPHAQAPVEWKFHRWPAFVSLVCWCVSRTWNGAWLRVVTHEICVDKLSNKEKF